jgi:hypothetical protein
VAVDCSAAGCCGSIIPFSVPGLRTSPLALCVVVFSTASGAGSDCPTAGRADVGAGAGTGIGSSASEELASFFASGGVVVMRSREVYAKGKQAGQSILCFR